MARFDLGGVLGAVLGGVAPARGRRRASARGGQDLGRALAVLAGAAIEAMSRPSPPAPKPAPGRVPEMDPWGAPPPRKPAPAKPARAPRSRASVPATGAAAAKPAPPRRAAEPAPPPIPAEDREGLLMLRAMVAAARADGVADAAERAGVAEQLAAAGLGAAARDAVLAEFDRATPPEELAREARDPMLAAQLYAAALAGAATIEGAERAWLDAFARALRLDRAAAEAIERRIRGG